MNMNRSRNGFTLRHPGSLLWRWLVVGLCLALLLGGVAALAEEVPPQEPAAEPAPEEVAPPVEAAAEPEPENVPPQEPAAENETKGDPVQYTVTFKDGDTEIQPSFTGPVGAPVTFPTLPTRDGYNSSWSDSLPNGVPDGGTTVSVVWDQINYTIRFIDGDGVALQTDTLHYGDTPVYNGGTPTKTGNETTIYSYTKWDSDIVAVTDNKDYIAQFDTSYKITWANVDGNGGTESGFVKAGEVPAHALPTKAATAEFTYSYAWDTDPVAVTGPATYTAVETQTKVSYDITWNNDDGTLIDTTSVPYGEVPTHADASKAATAQYTYNFAGWTPEIVAVTGTATYTATYTQTLNQYSVTFKNNDGSILPVIINEQQVESQLVNYGTKFKDDTNTIVRPADPSKVITPEEAAQKVYPFKGWKLDDAAGTPVTDDTTITADTVLIADYGDPVPRQYAVAFVNFDGTPLPVTVGETAMNAVPYDYGTEPDKIVQPATPTRPSDGDNIYTFKEWSPAIATVTADATYTAVYEAESLTRDNGVYVYKLNPEKTEATITAYKGSDAAAVVVPNPIDGYSVVGIGVNAFNGHNEITSLTIPAGVRTLGDAAFAYCTNLATLELPDTIEPLIGNEVIAFDDNLTSFVLNCTQTTVMNGADSITVAKPENVTVTVAFPRAFTDITVTTDAVSGSVGNLTVACDFTVNAGHTVNAITGGVLTNTKTMRNHGTIAVSGGTFTNSGTLYSCDGTVPYEPITNAEGAVYFANGQHDYNPDNGNKCNGCDQVKPEPFKMTFKYTGGEITKEYDKNKNATLDKKDFQIEDKHDQDVEITSVAGLYDEYNAGKRTVNVTLVVKGEGVPAFTTSYKTDKSGKPYMTATMTLDGTITTKQLVITPYDTDKTRNPKKDKSVYQHKTFGGSDPSKYLGGVSGVMEGDTMTGKMTREPGENVGKYRILQGTLDAGGNYTIVVNEGYFVIDPKNINDSDVGMVSIGNQRYTGEEVKPTISLRFGKNELKEGTDFKVEFKDNKQPGTATVTITGMGNYTGKRETSFRILNIASGGTGGSSGSGGGSYSDNSFGGDGEGDSEDGFAEADEEVESAEGHLVIDGVDYGVIFSDSTGAGCSFVQFIEEVTDEEGNSLEPKQWRLTVIADPLVDEETGETLMLGDSEDSDREQYGDAHLRLSMAQVETLTSLGFTEIVFEVENAEVHIPLSSMVSEIEMQQEELEVVDTIEGEEAAEPADDEETIVDENVDELEVELAATTVQVLAYDVSVKQIETMTLTDREQSVLNQYEPLTPTYSICVRAVLASDEEVEPQLNEDGTEIPPEATRLTELNYPQGMTVRILPLEDVDEAPEGAMSVYVSSIDDVNDPDVVLTNPGVFVDVDGMLYVELTPTGDGIYAVGRIPNEEDDGDDGEYESTGDDGEDEDTGDDDGLVEIGSGGGSMGGTTADSQNVIGAKFTVEDGKQVFDNQ